MDRAANDSYTRGGGTADSRLGPRIPVGVGVDGGSAAPAAPSGASLSPKKSAYAANKSKDRPAGRGSLTRGRQARRERQGASALGGSAESGEVDAVDFLLASQRPEDGGGFLQLAQRRARLGRGDRCSLHLGVARGGPGIPNGARVQREKLLRREDCIGDRNCGSSG
ncbi:hypothetical protein M885DRAFT_90839 [Pelagophyceae sp. CCMP2097]|nr:hypothetical protein M885DRAFT_90839 [Pelagophyceae sp. CCMP2097]